MGVRNAFLRQGDAAGKGSDRFLRPLIQHHRRLSARSRRIGNRAGSRCGQSLVEFALTLPVLFAFVFCLMEVSLAFYNYDVISESAREGTRYAMVRGSSCPTSANPTCEATISQVNTYVSGLGWPIIGGGAITPVTSYPSGNENVGSPVKVTVTYTFPVNLPFMPRNSITMSSSSQMVIIQ
jgi:Flp pilus assembly protein TadG